jgi:Ca2+-binding RTX toxin-like protein
MADGNVTGGRTFDVSAARLWADESFRFDGRAESDASFRILSGAGNDTLWGGGRNDMLYGGQGKDWMEGGAGADTYLFRSAAESTGIGYDTISGFDYSADRIDAPGGGSRAISQSASGDLSLGSFDADLASGVDGVLGAGQAALFTASGGNLSGHVFAVIDVNGVAGYQAGQDLVIELLNPVLPIDPTAGVIV